MPVWVSSKEADSRESRWRVRLGQLLNVEGASKLAWAGEQGGAEAEPSCPGILEVPSQGPFPVFLQQTGLLLSDLCAHSACGGAGWGQLSLEELCCS